jgi:uncharacterized protein (DUF1015 family)
MSITIGPIPHALVPVNPEAAARVSAPNYDEFQGDREIWEYLQTHPDCVLKVTMAHCDVESPLATLPGDSPEALTRSGENMRAVIQSDLTREVRDVLFVYEIVGPQNPDVRQIGLGCMARTSEIRTAATPEGPIIRNEGVREPKARGRANLIEACNAIIGTVNNAVPDDTGMIARALEHHADMHPSSYRVEDPHGNTHRIWIITDPEAIDRFVTLFSREPEAYVADGNHRSAAAAILGHPEFLTVFFTADRMGISAYNRLVSEPLKQIGNLEERLSESFEIGGSTSPTAYAPTRLHQIGLFTKGTGWLHLRPLTNMFDPEDAAASIDHDIVQRRLFEHVLDIPDAGDERLTFVGATKDAGWLQEQVESGKATYAVTLSAVTMPQFVEVCRQNKMMPPKSTWFEPKIRSGLVMALLD